MSDNDNCDQSTPQNDSTLTPRQKANRSNAKKSTGPRTAEGKARIRFNAIRHGLFAKETVSALSPADAKKYTTLLRWAIGRYQPADPIEQFLVEQLVHGIWGESHVQHWELFAVKGLAASIAQESNHGVSTCSVSPDAERLAAYGKRFHARWFKAMRELERLRDKKVSGGQQGSLQTHEGEEPAAYIEEKN